MKYQKLIVCVAIVCLQVGVSSAAIARNDCPDGSIVGGTYDRILINEFESCSIVGAVVNGDVIIRDADQITMLGNLVQGDVRVMSIVNATLVDNQIEGNLVANGNEATNFVRNVIINGNILVNDGACRQEQDVAVLQNLIMRGHLRVNCNKKADVKDNKLTKGNMSCLDNDKLDSLGNVALDGKMDCRRNIFRP